MAGENLDGWYSCNKQRYYEIFKVAESAVFAGATQR